ncbi:hypothetical protein ADL27_25120, partial [Streptomyces sp. NRRL F-6602]
MTTAPRHGYETKPWLALLDDVQKAPVAPPPTVVHAFRAGAARHPGRTALAYFDGRIDHREAD